jgi:signal transduction histidine kinase
VPEDSEQRSHDSYDRLLAQYQELAQLAGELAHEIKNPLSVIRMNMDLLAEDFSESASHNERRALRTIATVQSQCTRLENLLRDFLKFSHMRRLQLRPGSLNEQVERILDFYGRNADQQGVDIIKYLDPDLPSIRMDIESLEASLVNLVKNSIEAMPDGGQLTVRTRVTRGGVALDLIDTGCGMEVSTAMHMFEPFFSTKEGGSGLGLPTAKKIIEAHGGRIDVQSEVNHGTQFTLEFPVPPRLRGERETAKIDVEDQDVEEKGATDERG